MAKNIAKEIAELEGAISSPATPEAQKVVMRKVLEKLKTEQSSLASVSTKKPNEPKNLNTQKGRNDYVAKMSKPESDTTSGKIIEFSDGFKYNEVSKAYAKKNWNNEQIYGLRPDEDSEALIESASDIDDFDTFGVEYKAKAKASKPTEKDDNGYDCDELIAKEEKRKNKAKKSAEERANKTPATKNKEAIERATDRVEADIEKRLEKGEVSKSELEKLIDKTEALLKVLKSYLPKLK